MRYLRLQQTIVYIGVLILLIVTCNVFAKPLDDEVAIQLQAIPPEKLDPKVIQEAKAQPNVPLVVYLSDPFLINIVRKEQERAFPEAEALFQRMKLLLRPFAPNDVIPEPIRVEHRNLKAQQKAIISQMRRNIYSRIANRVAPKHEAFSTFVRQDLQGNVGAKYVTVNAVVIETPSEKLPTLVNYPQIRQIILNEPLTIDFELEHSVPTIGAEVWWNHGFDGPAGDPPPVKVGVLDTGVKKNHPALPATYGADDIKGHGTTVAGVIASHHSTNKGMLPGIERIYSGYIPYDLVGATYINFQEGLAWALNKDIDVLNISFAVKIYGETMLRNQLNDYTNAAQDVDRHVAWYSMSIVKSAGNEGDGNARITVPSDAYNAIVVGAMEDKDDGGYESRSGDTLWEHSSRGPTKGDSEGENVRKKPDITAPGVKIHTTTKDGAFKDIKGTSVAAPHVTGAIGILMDWGMYDPLQCKALLLNSADDWSPSGPATDKWDKHTGWGYLNLQKAWEGDNRYQVMTLLMNEGEIWYYKGRMTETSKATLVWNRGGDPDVALSNFDMYLYEWDDNAPDKKGAEIDNSTSAVDNVEQVVMDRSTRDVLLEIRALSVDLPGDVWSLAYSDTEQGFVKVNIYSYEFQFLTGLNGFGLPLKPIGELTSYQLISNLIPNCTEIYGWDANSQTSKVTSYNGAITGDNFTIDVGGGYFLQINPATSWSLVGEPIAESVNIQFKTGYNYVSFPYDSDWPEPPNSYKLLDYIDNTILIRRVNTEQGLWETTAWFLGEPSGVNFPLEIDKSYIVSVSQDTTFPPPPSAPPVVIVENQATPAMRMSAAPPEAVVEAEPRILHIHAANISAVSATITWNTDSISDGSVHYGITPALGKVAKDERGNQTTHWVVITHLTPRTKYYYQVVSGKTVDTNNGQLYTFSTTDTQQLPANLDANYPSVAFGQLQHADLSPAVREIIHLTVAKDKISSLPLAAMVTDKGYWIIDLWNLKESTGKRFEYRVGDNLVIKNYASGMEFQTQLTYEPIQSTGIQLAPAKQQKPPAFAKLAQNFPNPFNPDTWIPYQLSESAQVVIKIYNVQGQLIRTLDLGSKDAGYYTTKARAGYWDGKNIQGEKVASGAYFYTIKAGNFVATKRLVILK